MNFFQLTFLSVLVGFFLDLLIGYPRFLYHPVRLIGHLVSLLSRALRALFPETPRGELAAGAFLVVLVCAVSAGVPAAALLGLWLLSPWAYFALSCLLCWQTLASHELRAESKKVSRLLEEGDVEAARAQVSTLVGRDTAHLDGRGIARAAVETVAENSSDGVIAPLFFLFLGGAAGGALYKAVNTMDSMVGYRDGGFLYFGRVAARTDDVFNFLPARLTALLFVAAAFVLGMDGCRAFRVWRRDRRKHPSPNSAQAESAAAGALGVRLGGDAVYRGVVHRKPWLGDHTRAIEPRDVARTCRLLVLASLFAAALFSGVAAPLVFCL